MTSLSGFPFGMVGMITPHLVLYEKTADPRLLETIEIMALLVLVFGTTTTSDEGHPHLLSKGKDSRLLQIPEVDILLSQRFPIVATVPLHFLCMNVTREDLMIGILRIPNLDLVHPPGYGKTMTEFPLVTTLNTGADLPRHLVILLITVVLAIHPQPADTGADRKALPDQLPPFPMMVIQ